MKTIQLLFLVFTATVLSSCNSNTSKPEKNIEGVWYGELIRDTYKVTFDVSIEHFEGDYYEVKMIKEFIENDKTKHDEFSSRLKYYEESKELGNEIGEKLYSFSKDFKTVHNKSFKVELSKKE